MRSANPSPQPEAVSGTPQNGSAAAPPLPASFEASPFDQQLAAGVAGQHELEAAAPEVATVDDDGGVWPHTNRVLPWLVAIFLGMIWLVPFDSIRAPISVGVDSKLDRVVLVIMVGAWLMLAAVGGRHAPRFRKSPLNVAILLFVVLAITSVVANLPALSNLQETTLAYKKIALLIAYVTFFYFVATVVRPNEVRNFLRFMVILASLTALGTIWEYRTHSNLFYTWSAALLKGFTVAKPPMSLNAFGRPSIVGPTETSLADAAILSIALPFALTFLFRARGTREKLLYYVVTGLLLAGTISTLRKSAVLIPLGSLVVLAVYSPKRMARFAPAFIVLILAIKVISPGAVSGVTYQFQHFNNTATTEGRSSDYPAVTPDVLTHPFFGRGYGTYDPHIYRILDNQFLMLLIETGFLGLAAYALLLAVGGRLAHIAARSGDPERGPPGVALFAAIVGFAIASATFDVLAFAQVPYLLLFTLALAVVSASGGATNRTARSRRRKTRDQERRAAAVAVELPVPDLPRRNGWQAPAANGHNGSTPKNEKPSPTPAVVISQRRHSGLAAVRLMVAGCAAFTIHLLGRTLALLPARPTRPSATRGLPKRGLTRVVERLRHEQVGAIAAGVLAACGGLAALWFLLMLIAFGGVQHAAGTAAVAGAFALAWFAGFIHRLRRRPNRSQRIHRERRGF